MWCHPAKCRRRRLQSRRAARQEEHRVKRRERRERATFRRRDFIPCRTKKRKRTSKRRRKKDARRRSPTRTSPSSRLKSDGKSTNHSRPLKSLKNRFFDTRSHTARSRQTSMCADLPSELKAEDVGKTPTHIPAFTNDDSYNLLQNSGMFQSKHEFG